MHVQTENFCAAGVPGQYVQLIMVQLDSSAPWDETRYRKDCGHRDCLPSLEWKSWYDLDSFCSLTISFHSNLNTFSSSLLHGLLAMVQLCLEFLALAENSVYLGDLAIS